MVYLFPILLPLKTLCSLSNCLIFSEDLHAVFCSHASAAMELLATTQEAHLDQVVEEPTRTTEYSSSILDLFCTNNRTLINTVKIIPGISDHDAVFIESSLRPIVCKKAPRKFHVYNKADFSSITELNSRTLGRSLRRMRGTWPSMICGPNSRPPWPPWPMSTSHQI